MEAWLLTLTVAGAGDPPSQAIGPFWLLSAIFIGFALIRRALGPRGTGAVAPAALLFGVLAVALLVRLSPSAYGAFGGIWGAGSWWGQLQRDAFYDTQRFNGLFALPLIVAYLGWRGLTLGARLPTADQARLRLVVSVSALILAIILAVVAPPNYQPTLAAILVTLLAVGAFAGLSASSLIRWREAAGESLIRPAGARDERRWLATGLGLAALIAVIALVLGLSLNLAAILSLLRALGPVGSAVSAAIQWLTQGIAYLLYLLVSAIKGLLGGGGGIPLTPPHTPPVGTRHQPLKQPTQYVPPIFGVIAAVLFGLALLALIVALVVGGVRALLREPQGEENDDVDEDREALDARRLLEEQARGLFHRSGRRRAPADDLPVGASVRRLYREVLRAAAGVGLARRPGETPDEFAPRVAHGLGERGVSAEEAQVGALTAAYDDTRYGELNRDAPAPEAAVAEARRLTSALRRLASQDSATPRRRVRG